MDNESYKKITSKKEFSRLPQKDVERIYNLFSDEEFEEDKVKGTRKMLKKVYSSPSSLKLFNKDILDKQGVAKVLGRHKSTRERFDFYGELYSRLLKNFSGTVLDFGAGINGLSFGRFPSGIKYLGIEAMGQLVDLVNSYFKKERLKGEVFQESLFDLSQIEKRIKKVKGKKIVFLFKVSDSLEMVEKNYSKKFLKTIVPLVDRVVLSFATKSLFLKQSFKANRKWLVDFLKDNFNVLDDFELGGERYLVFEKTK